MALNWQTVHVPLAAGLQQKADERALEPPGLLTCKNAVFAEQGGIQKRNPFAQHSALSDLRRIVEYGDERIAFTKDAIHSWSEAGQEWIERAEYLAPKVTERSVFTDTSEQKTCDRAELSGVVFYAWAETSASTTTSYFAALDSETGAVIRTPVQLDGTSSSSRPRFAVLQSVVLLFWNDDGDLVVKVLDPTSISATGTATATVQAAAQFAGAYDVAQLTATSAVVVWGRVTTTAYGYATVSAAGSVSASTKARGCVGAIAVAVSENGSFVGVARENPGTEVDGDVLDASLADVATSAAIGNSAGDLNQLTFAWSEELSGSDLVGYAFWSSSESVLAASDFELETNTMTSAGGVGSQATLLVRHGPVSHAFCRASADGGDGKVYLWTGFASTLTGVAALQNTYFLYRADGLMCAKAAPAVAGGLSSPSYWLSGVQNLGGDVYALAVTERRQIPLSGSQLAYADRGPRDIRLEFDSDEARRCVELGRTLYIAGGQIVQYDGEGVTEVGFHLYPFNLAVSDAAAGNLADGSYTWSASVRWDNAKGDRERSAAPLSVSATMAGGGSRADITSTSPIPSTLKQGSRNFAAYEIWRTAVNPGTDSPRYLVTSSDPTATGTNGYLSNDPATGNFSTYSDNFADATLTTKETNPENGGVLESIAPPAASIIAASEDRLFLAGISYDPHLVWYSKLRGDGEVASFNDGLTFRVPATGGDITALAVLNETLVVFCERAIYAMPGDGLDNLGQGQNYGPSRLLSADCGAQSADAVALTPAGIVFKSSKGWYLLDRGFGVKYIGGPVADFDSDTITAVHVLETQHQLRAVSSARILMFDYLVEQWSEWEITAVHAAIWDGVYHYATGSAVFEESTFASTPTNYSLQVETAWIKLAGLTGYKRVRAIHILGEYRSAHRLRVEVARDYATTYFDDKHWTVSPTSAGGPEQVRHSPSIQKCEAIKLRITDRHASNATPPVAEGLKLSGLGLEVGFKKGLRKSLPATQKQ